MCLPNAANHWLLNQWNRCLGPLFAVPGVDSSLPQSSLLTGSESPSPLRSTSSTPFLPSTNSRAFDTPSRLSPRMLFAQLAPDYYTRGTTKQPNTPTNTAAFPGLSSTVSAPLLKAKSPSPRFRPPQFSQEDAASFEDQTSTDWLGFPLQDLRLRPAN